MTALNLFARPEGAWLIADTGHYDAAGRITGLSSKIVASERLGMALSASGRLAEGAVADIAAWLDRQVDQIGALGSISGLARDLDRLDNEAEENGALRDVGALPRGLRLGIALWDREAGRAKAAIIATTPELAGGAPSFTLRPVKTMFSPPLAGDPWPGHTFTPRLHMHGLAGAQRATAHADGTYRVAGEMEGVRVHADGIERFTVRTWPDCLGQTVRSTKPGLAGAIRTWLTRRAA